jgi:branched-chain amino acid transport system permease protein
MDYFFDIGVFMCIYGILALSLNLVMGETGLVSVAQAGFYGVGAYAAALLMLTFGVNFFIAAAIAMIVAALVALVVGIIFARLRDVYYVFGTVGLSIILYSVMENWESLTGGALGLVAIPRPQLFGFSFTSTFDFLLLGLVALAAAYGLCVFLKRSSFGRVLNAVREDEAATAVFGYRTISYKVAAFMLSAALAACAGALFASYVSYIDPTSFIVTESILILSIVILGGLGSVRGAVVGAVVLIILPEALRYVGFTPDTAAQMRLLVYGLALILLMLYRPQGLLGEFRL